MKRRIFQFLGVAAVVGGVMAPTAVLAQEYPTPRSTPTVTNAPNNGVSSGQATRPSSGSTLPFTGAEIGALTVAGVGAAGVGVVLVGASRRRARSQA